MAEQNVSNVMGSCARTSYFGGTYVFKWILEKYPEWPTKEENWSRFKLTNEVQFCISLEKDAYCYCTLKLVSPRETQIKMDHEISITDSGGNCFWTESFGRRFYRCGTKEHFGLPSQDMIQFSNTTQDQIIILKLKFDFFNLSTTVSIGYPMPSPSDNVPTLVKNFKAMYDKSLYTDVNLLVADHTVRAHKSVLSASSPVFAKMLSSPMNENSKDTIKITDIVFPILKSFIKFLYTGYIEDTSFDSVCALYYVADKYDVPSLQMTCSKIMLSQLDIENACRVLSLANLHSDAELKNSVLEFMKLEFGKIRKTYEWIQFVKAEPRLAAEVCP